MKGSKSGDWVLDWPMTSTVHPLNQINRLVALVLSTPSWGFVVSFVSYRIWAGPWPNFTLLLIPCAICMVSSMISTTVFLISFSDEQFTWRSIGWVIWAMLPLLLGIFYACWVWYAITIGEEFYGNYWNTW